MGAITPTIQAVVISGPVEIAPQTVLTPQATIALGAGASDTIPANANRKRITVMNLTSSVNAVKVGAAGSGTELVPGVWIDIYDTAAIPLHNPGGAAANIGYIEYE